MNKLILSIIFVLVLSGCKGNNEKEIIEKGVYQYVSAPYIKYSQEELRNNFNSNVIKNIMQLYMPYIYNDDEVEIFTFQESEAPSIEILNISNKEVYLYEVEVKFGQTYYLYDVKLKNNKINFIERIGIY